MASFRKDFEEFPKAFWYAGDAWFQAQDLGGNVGDPAEFSRLHRLTDLAVKKMDGVIYAKFDLKVTPVGHLNCIGNSLGAIFKQLPHFIRRLEVVIV